MGSTNVGKSTILNALIQGTEAMSRDDDCNIVASEKISYDDQNVFEISDSAYTCQTPGLYLHEDTYFVEYPDLGDFNHLKHFENQIYLRYVHKNAKSALIAFIIGAQEIKA